MRIPFLYIMRWKHNEFKGKGFIFLWIFMAFSGLIFGQQTQVDQNPEKSFLDANYLFNEKMYGAAFESYHKLLDSKVKLSQYQEIESKFRMSICAIELYQSDAEDLLNKFQAEYPWHPHIIEAKYYLSQFYYKRKNYKKTLEILADLDVFELETSQMDNAIFMEAFSLYKTNKIDEAKLKFGQLKASNTDNGLTSEYYYGLISYEQNDFNGALKSFKRLENERKFKNYIPLYISNIYVQLGHYDKVIESGEKAIKDSTTEKISEIQANVADAYYQKKNYGNAQSNYASILDNGGQLTPSQTYQAGISYYQTEKFAKTIDLLSQLEIKKDSLGQNIAWHLANAYYKSGDKIKARNGYQFASDLKFDKKIKELALLDYSKLSFEQKFEKESIEGYKDFLNQFPQSKYTKEVKESLVNILLGSNNPKEAIDFLETIPNRSDKLEEAYQKVLYAYAIDLAKNKKNEEALVYLNKSLESPVDKKIKASAYFWIGELSYKANNYDQAKSNFKNFLFIPESQETPFKNLVNYNIAYCYFKQEDYFYANNYFNKFIKGENSQVKSPRLIDAQLRSADCSFMLKNYSEALTGYQQVMDSKVPEGDYAYYQKGIILGVQRKSQDKINVLKAMTQKYPNSAFMDDALFAIAEELKNLDRSQEAIDAYQGLNTKYPKNPYYRSALLNVGLIYYNLEKDEKAMSYFKNIVKLYPYSDEAKTAKKQIENIFIEKHQTDSLDAFLGSIPNANLQNTSVDSLLYASAFSAIKDNDCDGAVKSLNKYIEKFGDNGYYSVDAHFFRGECSWKSKNVKTAIEDYNFVINRSPNAYLERALKASGTINYAEGNYEMASRRFEQLEDYTGNNATSILSLSGQMRSFYMIKRWDKCATAANRIINLGYADAELKLEAEYYLGKVNKELKQIDQASAYFDKVSKAPIKNEFGAESMYELANILFVQEKYKDAENKIFELNDKFSNYGFWRAKAFILLADVYVKNGDFFAAKNTLESIIENYEGADLKDLAKAKLEEIKNQESKINSEKENKKNEGE